MAEIKRAVVEDDRIREPWGFREPYGGDETWPTRVDERADGDVERWVQSACVLC
jgi:hypothetical protein